MITSKKLISPALYAHFTENPHRLRGLFALSLVCMLFFVTSCATNRPVKTGGGFRVEGSSLTDQPPQVWYTRSIYSVAVVSTPQWGVVHRKQNYRNPCAADKDVIEKELSGWFGPHHGTVKISFVPEGGAATISPPVFKVLAITDEAQYCSESGAVRSKKKSK